MTYSLKFAKLKHNGKIVYVVAVYDEKNVAVLKKCKIEFTDETNYDNIVDALRFALLQYRSALGNSGATRLKVYIQYANLYTWLETEKPPSKYVETVYTLLEDISFMPCEVEFLKYSGAGVDKLFDIDEMLKVRTDNGEFCNVSELFKD